MLPILYQSHNFILYSYPLLMGLGWGVAYQIFFSKADITPKYAQIIYWGIFISAWVGSKLFFYITTDSIKDHAVLMEPSFWTGGGFVFYGGLIFGMLFLCLYKLSRLPLTMKTLWAILPAVTAGHAIGRIGCLLAGCCFGAETGLWWGIHLHGAERHPTQILESLGLFLLLIFLLKSKRSISSFAIYFTGYGALRYIIEVLRGDAIRGSWGYLTPSQWISLAMILLGLSFLIFPKIKALRTSHI